MSEHDAYWEVCKGFIEIADEFVLEKNLRGAKLVYALYCRMVEINKLDRSNSLLVYTDEFIGNCISQLETGEDTSRWEWLFYTGSGASGEFSEKDFPERQTEE